MRKIFFLQHNKKFTFLSRTRYIILQYKAIYIPYTFQYHAEIAVQPFLLQSYIF